MLVAWALLGGGLVVTFAVLRRPETAALLCQLGAGQLGKALGVPLTFGACTLDPFTATLRLGRLQGQQRDARGERSLAIDSFELRLRPLQALAGGLEIARLRLVGLEVHWDPSPAQPTISPPPPPTGCWTQLLRLVHVEQLEVEGARLDLALPNGRLALSDLGIASQLSRGSYRAQVSARGVLSLDERPPLALEALALDAALDLPGDRLQVETLQAAGGHLALDLRGVVRNLCHPEPEVQVKLAASAKALADLLAPKLPGVKGDLTLSGSYRSRPEALAAEVDLAQVGVAGYQVPSTHLAVSGTSKRLQLEALHLDLGPQATADVSGTLEPKGRFPVEFDLEVRNGPFAKILDLLKLTHSWVDFRANLSGHFSGHLASGFALGGLLSADIANFVVDDSGWDQPGPRRRMLTVHPPVQLQSEVKIDKEGLHFDRARLRSAASEAEIDAWVHYDNRRGLKLTADFGRLDLRDFQELAGLPWSGYGGLSTTVEGPYYALVVAGKVDLEAFHFLGLDWGRLRGPLESRLETQVLALPALEGQQGSTSYRLSGTVDFAHQNRVALQYAIAQGRLEDLWALARPLNPQGVEQLRQAIAGEVGGAGELTGPADRLEGQGNFSFPHFSLFGRPLHGGTLTLHLVAGRSLAIDAFQARIGEGELAVRGQLGLDGPLDLGFHAQGLPLDRLLWPTGEPRADGALDLEGHLGGRFEAPLPSGQLALRDFEVFDLPLGGGRAHFETRGRTLALSGTAGDELMVEATAQLVGQAPYRATIAGATQHLERYLAQRVENPVTGALRGQLQLSGLLLDPGQSRGAFAVEQLELAAQRLRLENVSPISIGLEAGTLNLPPTTLRANGGQFGVEGRLTAEGDLIAAVNGTIEARALEGLLPRVERLGGELRAQVSVRGPMGDPAIVGGLQLTHGQFAWKGLPLAFSKVEASAEFSQRKVLLSAFSGELNGGELEVGGELLLEGFAFSGYDLHGTLHHVALHIPESIASRVDGQLQLSGKADRDLRLGGELHVAWARYNRNFDLETLAESFRGVRSSGLKSAGSDPRDALHLDIQLRGDGDLRVDNDLAHLALKGDLRVAGTSDNPGLFGQVVGRNGLVDFRGYRYQVPQALFSFADAERIAPSFDISADTDARQYRVFVHVFGTPASYQVQLGAQPTLSEEDVAKLLTIGITSQDNTANATTAGAAGYLGDVLWNISGLHDQVRRFIPRNDLIKDFSFNLGSAFIEATGQVEPVAQIESRVFTDRLRLRAQLPLSEAAGKRAQAEYQLSDHLSVQGEWNNDYSDYNIGDFGLDLRARWDFGD